MTELDSIGVYMPGWLYRSNESDRAFFDDLIKMIKGSGRYNVCKINLSNFRLTSAASAEAFCKKRKLRLMLEHDSRYYSHDESYKRTVDLLAAQVPFVNPESAHAIAHDKIAVAKLLERAGIPVLLQKIATSLRELLDQLEENSLYVIKPPDSGNGTGVKMIKKIEGRLVGYHSSKWIPIKARESIKHNKTFITLEYPSDKLFLLILFGGLLLSAGAAIEFPILGLLLCMMIFYFFIRKYQRPYLYDRIIIEPYFNDSEIEFSSLRCTVIGNEVVEAIRRTNKRDVVSNVDNGGVLEKYELSEYQKSIAIAAKNVVGADYAGVDLLVRGEESVIGEVNIGPITLYSKYTGVSTGKILADYLMKKCDDQAFLQTNRKSSNEI